MYVHHLTGLNPGDHAQKTINDVKTVLDVIPTGYYYKMI